jgi:integrase
VALELKKSSGWWYARLSVGGRLKRFPLTRTVRGKTERLAVRGQRPVSLKTMEGADAVFMDSWHQAKAAHDLLEEELRSKKTVASLTQRMVEVRTGSKKEFATIASIPMRWTKFNRTEPISDAHKAHCVEVLNRFVEFMNCRWPECKDLIDVREDQVQAFLESESDRGISARTWNFSLGLLKAVFSKLEPSSDAYTQFLRLSKQRKENTVHRKPFTAEEVNRLLEAARKDEVLRGPVHVACFTAMRKGDACCLKREAVNIKTGFIRTRTAKTDEFVEIPIMPPLAEELSNHLKGEGPYLFPEAAKLYRDPKKRSVLDRRFKDIMRAAGFAKDVDRPVASRPDLPRLSVADTRKRMEMALDGSGFQDRKKEKMRAVLEAYLRDLTLPEIAKELKISKSTVSLYLNTLEELCRCAIFRDRGPAQVEDSKEVLAKDQRGGRLKRGSRYGWHSFRTTFITQALLNQMPEELVRRVTGHSAVDVVRKHYFTPDQEDFRREFAKVANSFYLAGGEQEDKLNALRLLLEEMDGRNWKRVKREGLEILDALINRPVDDPQ